MPQLSLRTNPVSPQRVMHILYYIRAGTQAQHARWLKSRPGCIYLPRYAVQQKRMPETDGKTSRNEMVSTYLSNVNQRDNGKCPVVACISKQISSTEILSLARSNPILNFQLRYVIAKIVNFETLASNMHFSAACSKHNIQYIYHTLCCARIIDSGTTLKNDFS